METCIEYTEPGTAFISSDERKWRNAIKKLAATNPACVILAEPETNNGTIYAKFPSDWVKIKPKREMAITEEKKAILAENMRRIAENARKKKEG